MQYKNSISISIILVLFGSIFMPVGMSSNSIQIVRHETDQLITQADYVDISVSEAWDLLSTTDNGIQIPIDVRTDSEWVIDRIDTPFPEYARHFVKDDIIDEEGYQEFLSLYDGNDVIIYCKSGGRSSSASSVLSSRGFNGTVYNMVGGITDWKNQGLPYKSGNTDPEKPNKPAGPDVCTIDEIYEFSTQATDVDDDPVRFGWDFNDDGLVDTWTEYVMPSTTSVVEHSFMFAGTVSISVLTQDIVGATSDFSEKLLIQVNNPPSTPTINGPSQGKPGESHEFEIVSTDEDGDEITYFIDWGDGTTDGWTRTKPSGETLVVSHIWEEKNTYVVKVKAKDDPGAETDWATLEVQMPKTHSFDWLTQLFDQFHLLRQIVNILT